MEIPLRVVLDPIAAPPEDYGSIIIGGQSIPLAGPVRIVMAEGEHIVQARQASAEFSAIYDLDTIRTAAGLPPES
jgi:hypothetical protein